MLGGKKERSLEVQAFYEGTQNVGREVPLDGITARFAQEQTLVRRAAAKPLQQLEAEIEILKQRDADAGTHWRKLEACTDGMPPQIVLPVLAVLSAVFAGCGEAILISPLMEGFGISNLDEQHFSAFVVVLTASGFCKIAFQMLGLSVNHKAQENARVKSRSERFKKVVMQTLLVGFTGALIFMLSRFRAGSMIFAASLQQSALGRFFNEYRELTNWTVTLLTVALPIFAAVALNWGLRGLQLACEWRKARRIFLKVSRQLNEKSKTLEALCEERACRLAALEQERQMWTSDYLREYRLGELIGVRQRPFREVVIKIYAVASLILLVWLWLDPVPVESAIAKGFLAMLATLGLGGFYAYFVLQSWERPSPEQIYKHRAVIWREDRRQPATLLVADTIEQTEQVGQESEAEPLRVNATVASLNGNHRFQQERSL